MTTEEKEKQALRAKYHHLRDHRLDLLEELRSTEKELSEVIDKLGGTFEY